MLAMDAVQIETDIFNESIQKHEKRFLLLRIIILRDMAIVTFEGYSLFLNSLYYKDNIKSINFDRVCFPM